MGKKITLGIVICCVAVIGYWYINNNTGGTNYDMLNKILGKMNYKNELVDYDNEIGVKSIDDLAFSVKDGKIYLYYGKVVMELGKKELVDDKFMEGLERIGIKIKKSKNGKYKITYWGDEIQRWVN